MSYDKSSGGAYTLPNSSMAMISMIAGITGLTIFPVIGSIVAIITGYLAKKEIQESAGALGGDGLVKAGLILGWIGVGLAVLGLCVGSAFIALGLCAIPIGILSESSSWILPGLLGLFI